MIFWADDTIVPRRIEHAVLDAGHPLRLSYTLEHIVGSDAETTCFAVLSLLKQDRITEIYKHGHTFITRGPAMHMGAPA